MFTASYLRLFLLFQATLSRFSNLLLLGLFSPFVTTSFQHHTWPTIQEQTIISPWPVCRIRQESTLKPWRHMEDFLYAGSLRLWTSQVRQFGTSLRSLLHLHAGQDVEVSLLQLPVADWWIMSPPPTRLASSRTESWPMNWVLSAAPIRSRGFFSLKGFHRRISVPKPWLNERMRAQRLEWVLRYQDWDLDDWYRVIWTDESAMHKGNHRHWITRRSGEAPVQDCLCPAFAKRPEGVMIRGAICRGFKGPFLIWENS